MTAITPTVGRIILFWPSKEHRGDQPWAAIVTYVYGQNMINLTAFESNGHIQAHHSVPIVQEGSQFSVGDSPYAEWMVFQKGQAAKYEQLEKEAAAKQ